MQLFVICMLAPSDAIKVILLSEGKIFTKRRQMERYQGEGRATISFRRTATVLH
jgi:hypothetical protein